MRANTSTFCRPNCILMHRILHKFDQLMPQEFLFGNMMAD
uniref:Uncharacterized protein n=1 Tax=Arundo donax TaxID=35708 RepID=A0A0A9C1X9_ARUDO